jgi:HPt (histidine-containing phosphotransfer) domain-containing protein
MEPATIIDRQVFDRLCESVGGDVEFINELLQTFYADAEQQIAAMQAALAAADSESLRRAAHSLKSNSAGLGALDLSAHCRELEMLAKAGDLNGAPAHIAEIIAGYGSARAALQSISPV